MFYSHSTQYGLNAKICDAEATHYSAEEKVHLDTTHAFSSSAYFSMVRYMLRLSFGKHKLSLTAPLTADCRL